MTREVAVDEFLLHAVDKIRYADTDRQGHVNNAVFATLLETGRVEVLYDPACPLAEPGSAFVIARLVLDFHAEITWPGEVAIGTRVASIGRSSIRLEQRLYQNGTCVAAAETSIVQVDVSTRRARPLSQAARERLAAFTGAASAPVSAGRSASTT